MLHLSCIAFFAKRKESNIHVYFYFLFFFGVLCLYRNVLCHRPDTNFLGRIQCLLTGDICATLFRFYCVQQILFFSLIRSIKEQHECSLLIVLLEVQLKHELQVLSLLLVLGLQFILVIRCTIHVAASYSRVLFITVLGCIWFLCSHSFSNLHCMCFIITFNGLRQGSSAMLDWKPSFDGDQSFIIHIIKFPFLVLLN